MESELQILFLQDVVLTWDKSHFQLVAWLLCEEMVVGGGKRCP